MREHSPHKHTPDEHEAEFVADEEVVAEEYTHDTLKALREKLRACEKERQEFLDGWQRAKADFVNARKREEEERSVHASTAKEAVLRDVVGVLDSFAMATANTDAWEATDPVWRAGIEQIKAQLERVCTDHGLIAFGQVGEPFDPARHESVGVATVDDAAQDHTLTRVFQRGYRIGERVVRPARVEVGNWKGE